MGPITRTCSLIAVALALVAAPAAARDGGAAYLKARAAAADGDTAAAVAAYRRTLSESADPAIARSAYRAGVEAGDWALVRRALAILRPTGEAPVDAVVATLALAIADEKARDIDAALSAMEGGAFEFIVPIGRAWIAQQSGRGDPTAILSGAQQALAKRYAPAVSAQLLVARGRYDEAVAAARALDDPAARWAVARLLAGRGERARATAMFGADPGRGAKPGAAFGIAQVLLMLANDLASERAAILPVLLTRSAVLLQPDDARARVMLADALTTNGLGQTALAVLDADRNFGPFSELARDAQVRSIAAAGGQAALLPISRAQADAPDADATAIVRYGDALFEAERFDDAIAAYRRAYAKTGPNDPQLLMRLASALDRAGRWEEAKPLLAQALELAPDNANVLNTVGYARLERGEDLRGSLALLERALKADPDSAAIQDSVGWGYFLTGDATRALPILEKAAAKESDPEINEHLGDVYWALGRRIDARYAWAAAAVDASPEAKARLAARAERGPPPRR